MNGIRAVIGKGFIERVQNDAPDILCLQETKAFAHQMPPEIKLLLQEYQYVWHHGQTPGYAGTAIFYKDFPGVLETSSIFADLPMFYEDGRVTQLTVNGFALLNIYFPNGNPRADGQEMLGYKMDFYEKFITYCNALVTQWKHVIVCGDFNICHREIDIARPKENANSIGFLAQERAMISKFIDNGYVDCFRMKHGDMPDKYTWWSYRAGARPRNVGWRLDYFFISESLREKVQECYHQDQVMGSDHCPVSLLIDL